MLRKFKARSFIIKIRISTDNYIKDEEEEEKEEEEEEEKVIFSAF